MAFRSRILGRHTVTTPQPMSELNITPLIDVLLVLLVMLILSIPIATHQVEVDLPSDRGTSVERQEILLAIMENGTLLWNGEAVSSSELDARLSAAASSTAEPVIKFEPAANASYEDAADVIHAAGEANVTRFAFVGNHQYASFDTD